MTDFLALGRRAMAAGWRWQAGALAANGHGLEPMRVVLEDVEIQGQPYPPYDGFYIGSDGCLRGDWVSSNDVPDFRDPATLGILLAQVREAWGEADLFASRQCDTCGEWWVVCRPNLDGGECIKGGATEAEALVAALEAAMGVDND